MFAAIENLIGLLIFLIISGLAAWQKSRQEKAAQKQPSPRRTAPPPVVTEEPEQETESWEEELKRLLREAGGQETPAPTPPPIQRPPPVMAYEPPPLEATEEPVLALPPRPAPVAIEPKFKPLPGFTESTQRYAAASHLDRQVEQRMRDVVSRPVGTTRATMRPLTAEATATKHMLRDRQTLRAALLASVVLGPPKALAE